MVPVPLEFDCPGLVDGWARRLHTHEPVNAAAVTKADGPFYCPECHSEVIVRKGSEKGDHFAHQSPQPAAAGSEESNLHRACKEEICAALALAHPEGSWAVERAIPANGERGISEVRPDASGRVRGWRVAIEVQASALDIESILRRMLAYSQRGIHVLWLVPLHQQPSDEEFRPRLYERYFHSLYLGRTYYWWPGLGASVLPMHYGTARRHIPYADWYQPGGKHVEVGGYDVSYRAVRRPLCGPKVDIGTEFAPHRRGPFTPRNERKAVPGCDLWLDRLDPWW